MKAIIFILSITLLQIPQSFCAIREDMIEVEGRIGDFNEEYVTLINMKKMKTYVPRNIFTQDQMRSNDYLRMQINTQNYLNTYYKVMQMLEQKRGKRK